MNSSLFQLEQMELYHHSLLSNEWKRREEEREKEVQLKMEEMDRLAEDLKQTLKVLEKREKSLEVR